MSTNKVLKLAKAAIDKKDYEAALKHCQDVFIRDASNYNGNVFAGLACLQLSRHDDARRHYSTAIETQPDNPLAWKGLANYYDKHRPVVQQEQLDALNTYSKLLSFVESDATKTSSILFKMAVLHEVLSQHSEVLSCYGRILATTEEGAELPTEKVATMISHFLSQKDTSLAIWGMLVKAFDLFEGDTKSGVRSKFVSRGMAVYKASISLDGGLHAKLVSECEELLSCQPQHALLSLVQLTLWEQAPAMQVQYPCDVSLELTSNQKGWCEQLGVLMDEGTLDATGLGVACAGDALVKVTDGKWIDAKTVIENGLTSCPAMCELHLLSVIVHLRLHDYHNAELEGQKGLKCASSFPKCLITSVQTKLKLCLLCVATESEDGPQSKALANEFSELMSGDLHMTALVTRGYILAGELPQAREVLHTLQGQESAKHLVCALQGEIFLSMEDWDNAIKQLTAAIEQMSQLIHSSFSS
ncbi:superkiller complex protein 3-like isoform X2 [Halichondria panicea]|uniref:superkiller complex protein 3-like isoform X2 n=1 Tax=Halichondria panicea TaxID=6063 RepID=UPI00312B5D78